MNPEVELDVFISHLVNTQRETTESIQDTLKQLITTVAALEKKVDALTEKKGKA